jgi:hypothetical protein
MIATCAHTKTLERLRHAAAAEQPAQQVRHRRPALRPLVQPEGDARGVPEEQRRDDARDQGQDQIRLAEMAALEASRSLHLADQDRADHAHEHHHGEHVDHQREPALVPEPGERGLAVHGADHRDHDRGEEDEEAPEDRCVDQARYEPLEQLPLAEHDHGLVLDALGHVAEAVHRLAEPHQIDEQLGPPREQRAADGEQRGERDSADGDVYEDCTFLSSSVIAGTISARSPITA